MNNLEKQNPSDHQFNPDSSTQGAEVVSAEETIKKGREAYQRLGAIYARSNPYGVDLATPIRNYLTEKLTGSISDRIKWLNDNLKLNVFAQGKINYDNNVWVLTIELLSKSYEYGAEDLIPLLRFLISELKAEGVMIPAEVEKDIELVQKWMRTQFSVEV